MFLTPHTHKNLSIYIHLVIWFLSLIYQHIYSFNNSIFRCVSISGTYPSEFVSRFVRDSQFQISTVSVCPDRYRAFIDQGMSYILPQVTKSFYISNIEFWPFYPWFINFSSLFIFVSSLLKFASNQMLNELSWTASRNLCSFSWT